MENLLASKQELDNCSFVKTILMLLVVICHSIRFWHGDWFSVLECVSDSIILSITSEWLNSFHIYGFALCSGYLYSYLKYEREKYSRFSLYISAKIKRLIVPYIFCCLVWIVPITQYFYHYETSMVINKYVLATSPSQLWFLWMLFDNFILVWPLSNIVKNDILAIFIGLTSFGIGVVGSKVLPNVFSIWTAFSYIPFFILGMKLREKKEWNIRRIHPAFYIIVELILFAIWMYVSNQSGVVMTLLNISIGFILHIIGALMAFFVFQWFATKVNWKENKVFIFLSKRSMPIYLFHQQVIYFTIIWLNGKVNPYVNAAVNFVVAMAVSILISSVLMKFKWTRFLIGEK